MEYNIYIFTPSQKLPSLHCNPFCKFQKLHRRELVVKLINKNVTFNYSNRCNRHLVNACAHISFNCVYDVERACPTHPVVHVTEFKKPRSVTAVTKIPKREIELIMTSRQYRPPPYVTYITTFIWNTGLLLYHHISAAIHIYQHIH